MNKTLPSVRWLSGSRAAQRSGRDDPADMGTAFGLELSLIDPADLDHAAAPASAPAGWLRRIGARFGVTTPARARPA